VNPKVLEIPARQTQISDGLIPPDLTNAICHRPDPGAIKALFNFCHKMAIAYVKVKTHRGSFDPLRIGLTPEDFALDAIAELFRQDRGDRVMAFASLGPREGMEIDPVRCHNEIRRIVFGAVNQHIYRSFRQSDPTLARLIRNIKSTATLLPDCQLLRWQDELVLVPMNIDMLFDRPAMAEELLRIEYYSRVSGALNMRAHVGVLMKILVEQTTYRRAFPVTAFALLVRPLMDGDNTSTSMLAQDEHISQMEIEGLIKVVVLEISNGLLRSYLASGKLSVQELLAYEKTLTEILVSTYIHEDGNSAAFSSILAKYLPELDKTEYVQRHRVKLEYAVKQAKTAIRDRAKPDLGFL
jgi:hypothetical protein